MYISFSRKVEDMGMKFIDSILFLRNLLVTFAKQTKDQFETLNMTCNVRYELLTLEGVYHYDHKNCHVPLASFGHLGKLLNYLVCTHFHPNSHFLTSELVLELTFRITFFFVPVVTPDGCLDG